MLGLDSRSLHTPCCRAALPAPLFSIKKDGAVRFSKQVCVQAVMFEERPVLFSVRLYIKRLLPSSASMRLGPGGSSWDSETVSRVVLRGHPYYLLASQKLWGFHGHGDVILLHEDLLQGQTPSPYTEQT